MITQCAFTDSEARSDYFAWHTDMRIQSSHNFLLLGRKRLELFLYSIIMFYRFLSSTLGNEPANASMVEPYFTEVDFFNGFYNIFKPLFLRQNTSSPSQHDSMTASYTDKSGKTVITRIFALHKAVNCGIASMISSLL